MLHCYKDNWILYYISIIYFLILTLKEIKIFSWAPGSVPRVPDGPKYCNRLQTGLQIHFPHDTQSPPLSLKSPA